MAWQEEPLRKTAKKYGDFKDLFTKVANKHCSCCKAVVQRLEWGLTAGAEVILARLGGGEQEEGVSRENREEWKTT